MSEINKTGPRDFSTISPSAKKLILMKGYTDIPYARRTAELLMQPYEYVPDYTKNNFTFWARLLHFENRYRSIDQLLFETGIKNVLELSSGFSFRGLETVKREGYYYIDTDLPEMISDKKALVAELTKDEKPAPGTLELLALNALDENSFNEIASRFPKGELAIVNEGLLMYLPVDERRHVCEIIHRVLQGRGGCWITADIYLRKHIEKLGLDLDQNTKDFFEQHDIENNKYDTFQEAENFFRESGFCLDKEAFPDMAKMSTVKYFLENLPPERVENIKTSGKIQATWRLRVV